MRIEATLGEIDEAINKVKEYEQYVVRKSKELSLRLAEEGMKIAKIKFDTSIVSVEEQHIEPNIEVTINEVGETAIIRASGKEVAFIEFGAGMLYGYGYPDAGKLGVGPGTYPNGKGNWNKLQGWNYKDENGKVHHTYGTPVNMPMYNTIRELEQKIESIATEVFKK